MEKSIELVWKEGFLKNSALLAPKLNDLYNRKSKHIIDKYIRMFKMNMILLSAGSFLFLVVSFFMDFLYVGILMFLIFNIMVLVDRKLFIQLKKIDKNCSSYEYLKMLNAWMGHKTSINIKMARVLYPYTFVSTLIGLWFFNIDGMNLGKMLVAEILLNFPDAPLFYGIPLMGIAGVLIIISLLVFFGERLYKWDLNLVYGNVLDKLNELLSDMEELRS